MRANLHDRSRQENNLQDVRVGRHREKLEQIRDSLRPFEQGNDITNEQQKIMLDTLISRGYNKDAAFYALKLVKFISVDAAIDVLRNIKNDHEETPSTSQYNPNQETRISFASININNPQNGMTKAHMNNGTDSLHPHQNWNMDDSGSSRSNSPLPPQQTSPSTVSSSQTGGGTSHGASPFTYIDTRGRLTSPLSQRFTPVAPDYHRSHIHISTAAPPYHQLEYSPKRVEMNKSMISIHQGGSEKSVIAPSTQFIVRDSFKSPQEGSTASSSISSYPSTSSQLHIARLPMTNGPISINNYGPSSPVIRTSFTDHPKGKVHIGVAPGNPSEGRLYRLDVSGRDGVSVVQGSSNVTGIQSIMVDPDQTRVFVGYEDELRPSTSEQPSPIQYQQRGRKNGGGRVSPPNQYNRKDGRTSPNNTSVDNVIRSVSPLPESIAARIKNHSYQRMTESCQPRMYCFFMEQHVERLIQQYKERVKRSHQLQREMEAAHLADQMKSQMLTFLQHKESKYNRLRRQKMDKDMFDLVKHIGVGAFGTVSLVKKKDSGQVYAMKSLLKKDVIMKQQAAHVKAERDILAEADSPWIVKLFFSFQDDRCLYFIMEYVPGGDMMQLLINKGVFEEKLARFYIAELTCAIEYVHSLGFIHRDIKPDNILIDQNGHIKLTDFGLCTGLRWTHDKRYYPLPDSQGGNHIRMDSFTIPQEFAGMANNMKVLNIRHQKKRDQAHSLVGTGNYMAPEVIRKTGHTQLCDWWSVGVILYEMVYGRPPFISHHDDHNETQHKITHWREYLIISPNGLSSNCRSLIKELCCDEMDRMGKEGAQQVMNHPWFRGIEWKTLRNVRAEFVPRVEHAEDTSNFDTIEVSESAFETLGKKITANNPAFYEFTFRHFFDMDGQGCPSLRSPQKRPSLAPLFESNMINRNDENSSTESIVI